MQRMPFDWKNPVGYPVAISLQFGMLFFLNVYLACFLTLAFGYYLFTLSIAENMTDELHLMTRGAKMQKSAKQILTELSEFISIHADVKELS